MSNPDLPPEPIQIPFDLLRRPGLLERLLMCIPVVGWFAVSCLEERRIMPIDHWIRRQLLKRCPRMVRKCWNEFDADEDFVRYFCSSIKENFCWPNDLFIPQDSCEALFLYDEGESDALRIEVESWLELTEEIDTKQWEEIHKGDLGMAVSTILGYKNGYRH
jgi:hypothetical protein